MNQINTGNKNIKCDYIFCFLKNLNFAEAIWVIYLSYRGLSLWQIGVLEGIFHLSGFLFEVPSGVLADLFGRKNVMFSGRISSMMATVFMVFSHSFAGFGIGMVLSALAYNLNSGSEEALLYDSARMAAREKEYMKISSRWNVLGEGAMALATFAGGILAEISYFLCYGVDFGGVLISLFPLLFMKEPDIRVEKEKISLRKHCKEIFCILKEKPEVIKILTYYPIIGAFYITVYFYCQKYFTELGASRTLLGLIFLLCGGLSCLGALCSPKLYALLGERMKYGVALCMGISILVIAKAGLTGATLALMILGFFNALLEPVKSFSLNQLIPSQQRATIISIESMCYSVAMILFFPLSGALADRWGLSMAFIVLGITQFMMAVLFWIRKILNVETRNRE